MYPFLKESMGKYIQILKKDEEEYLYKTVNRSLFKMNSEWQKAIQNLRQSKGSRVFSVKEDNRYLWESISEICYYELACEPFMNTVWSPKQFRFIKPDPRYGDWFFAGLDSTKPFTHLWFHKQFLQSNEEARMKYIKELENKIIETGNKPITA